MGIMVKEIRKYFQNEGKFNRKAISLMSHW